MAPYRDMVAEVADVNFAVRLRQPTTLGGIEEKIKTGQTLGTSLTISSLGRHASPCGIIC